MKKNKNISNAEIKTWKTAKAWSITTIVFLITGALLIVLGLFLPWSLNGQNTNWHDQVGSNLFNPPSNLLNGGLPNALIGLAIGGVIIMAIGGIFMIISIVFVNKYFWKHSKMIKKHQISKAEKIAVEKKLLSEIENSNQNSTPSTHNNKPRAKDQSAIKAQLDLEKEKLKLEKAKLAKAKAEANQK